MTFFRWVDIDPIRVCHIHLTSLFFSFCRKFSFFFPFNCYLLTENGHCNDIKFVSVLYYLRSHFDKLLFDFHTFEVFEFIDSIPVILNDFRCFFLVRWFRLPCFSPMFITVLWMNKKKKVIQNMIEKLKIERKSSSHHIVTNLYRLKIDHRMCPQSLYDHRHKNWRLLLN